MGLNMLYIWTIMQLLCSCGVTFDESKPVHGTIKLFISVPEHSYKTNCHDEEVAGAFLAKYTKQVLDETIGHGIDLDVAYRVRKGETWTVQQRNDKLLEDLT